MTAPETMRGRVRIDDPDDPSEEFERRVNSLVGYFFVAGPKERAEARRRIEAIEAVMEASSDRAV